MEKASLKSCLDKYFLEINSEAVTLAAMSAHPELIKKPLWFYIKRHPRAVAVGMVSLLATNFLDAIYPLLIKEGLDQIEAKASLDDLGRTTFALFAIMASLAITRYGWRMGFGYFHTQSGEHIRRKIFNHLSSMTPQFFQKNTVGELMSLLTNDVQSFRQAIGPGLLILADGFMMAAMILPIMLSLNASWTLQTLIFLPVVPFLTWKVLRLIHMRFKEQQEKFAEITGFAQENISGIRVIKSYSLEQLRLRQFQKMSSEFETKCNRVAIVDSLYGPAMEFGVASGAVILLFIAQNDLVTGATTIGTFFAFHRYIQKMVWPMTALGMGLSMFQKGWASFDRIKDNLMTQPLIQDSGTAQLTEIQSIELKNVTFSYPDSQFPSLQNISFTLRAGEQLGILGSVSSGKSTLLQLLLRFYEPQSGQILINGHELSHYTLQSLREQMTLIPQENFLFSDTVIENLSFARSTSLQEAEIETLLETVDLTDEIKNLPEQLQSQLGEKGVNLSGGQKQRIAIARGLARSGSLLILDDTLSAVDTKTEAKVKRLLKDHPCRTKIIVAHRLSSLEGSQKILVLRDGQKEFFGTLAEAEVHSPTYLNIQKLQSESSLKEETTTAENLL